MSDDYKIVSDDKETKLVVAAVFCDKVIIEYEEPLSLRDVTWATISVDLELLEERRGDYRFWLASNKAEIIDFLKGWYGTKAVHVKDLTYKFDESTNGFKVMHRPRPHHPSLSKVTSQTNKF